MPKIQFDVLVPAANATEVRDAFQNALDILVDKQKLTSGTVGHDPSPSLPDDVVEQLRQTYRDEHDGAELADASVNRYLLDVAGASGSYNQLTMALSRILTPQATLPGDPAALQREAGFEVAAIYPWMVEVRR